MQDATVATADDAAMPAAQPTPAATSSASDDEYGAHARARRLYLQQAPAADVRAAIIAASADWTDVDEQEKVLHAPGLASASGLSATYRQRLLKLVLDGLGRQNCEVHEELLGAYLALLQQKGDDDAPAGWSTLAFERRGAATVRLRVRDTIGGGAETGCVLWPAALLLAGWLERRADALAGLRVLELGAGAGLPGLVAARCAAVGIVTLTDVVPATLENLRHNYRGAAGVEVRALDWHACAASEAAGEPPVDLVLCADVVYEPTLLPALAATLKAILRRSAAGGAAAPRALLAAERRSDELWSALLGELARVHLKWDDLGAAARAEAAKEECGFFVPEEALPRLQLLELRAVECPNGKDAIEVGRFR